MDEYDYEDFDGYQLFLNIEEVRMLYSHITYSIQMWPGYPARPAEEQEYLQKLKMQLFAMMADYQLENG